MELFQSVMNSLIGAGAGFFVWNIVQGDGGVVSFMCAGILIATVLTNERI